MATTAIIINSTDGLGKSMQKSMTCVNPDATNEQLAHLGQMITAAQNHTYGNTVRIDKTDCDLEASKTTPNLTASITTYSAATDFSGTAMKDSTTLSVLTYNGDGNLFVSRNAYTAGFYFKTYNDAAGARVGMGYYADNPPTFPVTFTVGFTETENYKACAVEITVTA